MDNSRSGDFGISDLSQLNDNEKILYIKLKDFITEIADGKKKETIIDIDNLKFIFHYKFNDKKENIKNTIEELISDELSINKIENMLLADCPYELYWHRKCKGNVKYDYKYEYIYTMTIQNNYIHKVFLKYQIQIIDQKKNCQQFHQSQKHLINQVRLLLQVKRLLLEMQNIKLFLMMAYY